MKNNEKGLVNLPMILIATSLFCLGMLWLVDQGFNGVIKEWIYNLFYIDPRYADSALPYDQKIGVLFRSWPEIKGFFIYGFIAFILILALCMSVSTYLYARYSSKKDIAFITNVLKSYMDSNTDDLVLPKRYFEIGAQLIKIKSMSQKHQQLMQMEMQRKNDLITYLAHDLKTPLASVIGYLSLLNDAPDMPAEQKAKYTGIALDKAYRLEELIHEFFEITRFNLQSIVLNKGKIKLAFMLQQLADEFYPMLTPQGKKVLIHAPDELILVGDADKLARVFNNILKNAIAYSYENSVIDITAVQQAENVIITFTNRGDPIPPQKLDTIFEKFYRLDSARSTDTGGAGLGLAIAQEIIAVHNGIIVVESKPEYTVFTVKLPS
ncbi:signal transduction histidine kinase [Desulfitobacterium dehalogenans ATCC 51507]|uniref:histidine kinase n=1 Tax=Desulfitobacterium dehalogenans (strain ATCC 51507 / DSM 9161 / JW/IU-DC1) TaxID=756499 RepID=I4A867_DESDJ|nr:HAMP domain-containing sensor histidine kinase [Desulfitobacterium dehalogenans]AFM00152.1 signal transduction histidine kinase [Desulfitobacterium dehalogenans ATCC 51507]